MKLALLIPPIFSFILTLLGISLMLKFFPRLRLMDRPHEYGLNRAPIPYSGGIIFFIVFAVSALLFVNITGPILGVIVAGFLITLISFIDDRVRLSPWLRLAAQAVAGIIVVLFGVEIQVINAPFGLPLFLDKTQFQIFGQTVWLFSALAIVIWLILMMNVMNWMDGIPGLASGITVIAQAALFLLSTRQFHIVDQSAIITISSVIAAGAGAFLIFDFPKPKILMGDSGSMFLGFMLGVLSILAGGKLATAILIMCFPVLDAFWVIIKRIIRGGSPLKGDNSHLHHKLLNVGLSEKQALFFNYSLCSVCAAIALTLNSSFSKFIAFIGVLFVMGAVGVVLYLRTTKYGSGR